jgi:catechol 2,3-dioxygenase-like lactoylglutathione lyase family enzyme
MSSHPPTAASFAPARLVPELLVTSLAGSLRFWCDLCGFKIAYDRPDEGFAYLDLAGAQVMLEERGHGRNWIVGEMAPPFGRGINFQISVPGLEPIIEALRGARWPLYMEPEQKSYRVGHGQADVHQFLVQDPDGYLIRFSARHA